MKNRSFVGIFLRMSMICLLLLGVYEGSAQTKKTKTQSMKNPPAMQQTRRTTNKDRWAAAARHADRRAAHVRKNHGQVK